MSSTNRLAIASLAHDGLAVSEIARRLGLAPATVRYHLSRLSATPPADDPLTDPPPAMVAGTTRLRVRALLGQGVTRAEIARCLGVSKATVSYHARRLGETVDQRCARRYDWPVIQRYYDEGHSARECSSRFGFTPASWSQAVRRGAITARPTSLSIEELCVDGTPRGRGYLKLRLRRAGLKADRCERCGLTQWQGQPLSFALHHVNGRRLDNRLENLQLLCPNCPSQTENFAGRRRSALEDAG